MKIKIKLKLNQDIEEFLGNKQRSKELSVGQKNKVFDYSRSNSQALLKRKAELRELQEQRVVQAELQERQEIEEQQDTDQEQQ